MTLSLNIPGDAERALRDAWGEDLDRAAFEALVIEGYRSSKFGSSQVRQLLNLKTRWDAEKWLGDRGVYSNYSLDDLEDDRRALNELFGTRN